MKIAAVPPDLAEQTHRPLTEAIRQSDFAYYNDGTLKGNLLDLMLAAHAKQGALLVRKPAGYEIWIRKEENGATRVFSKEDFR